MMTDTFLFTHLVLHGTAVFKVAKAMTRFEERKEKKKDFLGKKVWIARSLLLGPDRQTDRQTETR